MCILPLERMRRFAPRSGAPPRPSIGRPGNTFIRLREYQVAERRYPRAELSFLMEKKPWTENTAQYAMRSRRTPSRIPRALFGLCALALSATACQLEGNSPNGDAPRLSELQAPAGFDWRIHQGVQALIRVDAQRVEIGRAHV